MKNYLLVLYFFLFSLSNSIAQSDVMIQDRLFKSQPQSAFVVSLERTGIKDKDMVKEWESYLKEFDSKVDFDKDAKMYVSEDAQVTAISNGPLQVFMRKNNLSDQQTEFSVWIKDANGNFVGSNASDAKESMASQWVLNYAINIKRNQIKELLDDMEDDLESITDDKEDLDDDIKSREEEIKDLREDIKDEEEKIKEAKKELPGVEEKLRAQTAEVEKLKRTLQELESRKKEMN